MFSFVQVVIAQNELKLSYDSEENDFLCFMFFGTKGPDFENLSCKTLCQMLIMIENFQI